MVVLLLFLASQPPFSCSGAACCSTRCCVRRAGPVATPSRVDGRPLRACLTGNRCASSEDEGPPHKHYWRTSAACHNRSGAPHPSIHQPTWRAGAGGLHPPPAGLLTNHSPQGMLGMFGPGTCPPPPDQCRIWPMEKTLQCV